MGHLICPIAQEEFDTFFKKKGAQNTFLASTHKSCGLCEQWDTYGEKQGSK